MQTQSQIVDANKDVRAFFRVLIENVPKSTARIVVVNKNNVSTTLTSYTLYESGIEVKVPSSYVNSTNLPATAHVYLTERGVETQIGTLSLSITPTVSPNASTEDLNDVVDTLTSEINSKAPTSHTHDDRYYTESEVDTRLAPTKRVTMSLGSPNFTNAAATFADWAERYPIMLPVTTTRWRLRVANSNLQNTGAALTSPVTVSDIYKGNITAPGTGRITAVYSGAPTKVADGGTATSGTEFVSAWITNSAHQFQANTHTMVGWNFSSTGGGNGLAVKASRYGYRNNTAGAASSISVSSGANYVTTTGAFDVRIEFEFVGTNPVGLFIGASNDEGFISGTGVGSVAINEETNAYITPQESWPGVFGLRNNALWVNAAICGATETPFMASNRLAITRFDLATTIPDFAVINLGANSILAGTAVATVQSNVSTVVGVVRGLGIKRIFLTTMQPAALSGTNETNRQTYNTWVRSVPMGVNGILDFDFLLRDPANTVNLRPEFALADNAHIKKIGHQWLGTQVDIR